MCGLRAVLGDAGAARGRAQQRGGLGVSGGRHARAAAGRDSNQRVSAMSAHGRGPVRHHRRLHC